MPRGGLGTSPHDAGDSRRGRGQQLCTRLPIVRTRASLCIRRDWCLTSGTGATYIEPGSPWQKPWIESFNARLRDEVRDTELFSSLAEAKLILAECLERYNSGHPHSSLGMLPPARFAVAWRPEAGLGESA